jgi:AraC-like DNA-binding protein
LFELDRDSVSERYEIIHHGGGGAPTTLVCGTVRFDHPAARQLVNVLPRTISVEAWSAPQLEWLQSTLRFMAAEASELRPGGETVVTRLADILVIQAIRSWLSHDPAARTGWLGALRDAQIGQALALIHRDPVQPWTVALLAHEVAMSRSAFAARFTALVGETPMRYVTRWRMQVALTALRDEGVTLGELALRLGYQSEAAFSRAFKRCMGVSPGAARRSATALSPVGLAAAP